MASPGVDEDISFGVCRHAGSLARGNVVRELQQIGGGIEGYLGCGNLGVRVWRKCGPGKEHHTGQNLQKPSHSSYSPDRLSYLAAVVFTDAFNMSFCTR